MSYKPIGFLSHEQDDRWDDAGTEDAEWEDEIGVAEHGGLAAVAAVARGLRQIRTEIEHWF